MDWEWPILHPRYLKVWWLWLRLRRTENGGRRTEYGGRLWFRLGGSGFRAIRILSLLCNPVGFRRIWRKSVTCGHQKDLHVCCCFLSQHNNFISKLFFGFLAYIKISCSDMHFAVRIYVMYITMMYLINTWTTTSLKHYCIRLSAPTPYGFS